MRPMWGKYLGEVKDIADPKKMRRIVALIPEIDPVEPLGWALPCDAYPTDWLPEVGDYVWIEFRGGLVDHPLWVGRAVAKADVDTDFVAAYGSAYRKDHDANGNEIEWTSDGSSLGAAGIRINGTKRLANEDLAAWIKTNVLDWIKTNITSPSGWLSTHANMAYPVLPAHIVTLTVLDTAFATIIADYEAKRAAGGANLTDKTKAG